MLADADKRQLYDRFGHAGVSGSGGGFDASGMTDLGDIFGEIFGLGDMFGGGRRRSRAQRGADLRQDLTLEFEEAVFGVEKQVKIRRHETCDKCRGTGSAPGKSPVTCRTCEGHGQVRYQQGFFSISRTCSTCQGTGTMIADPCDKCRGQGRIVAEKTVDATVPAGVEDGTRIRFSGYGEAGAFGGPAGDLYIVLHVKEHAVFEREGNQLFCVIPLSFPQATLGTEIQVRTLEGDYQLKIPEGTQSGHQFRIKNRGVPVLNGRGKGDLYVEVRVQTPSKLNKRQRELLQELEQTLRVENKPQRRSLLGKVKDIFN